jgi:hypothetical protein
MRRDDAIETYIDAAREALAFAAQRDRADLDHDRMLVLALMRSRW